MFVQLSIEKPALLVLKPLELHPERLADPDVVRILQRENVLGLVYVLEEQIDDVSWIGPPQGVEVMNRFRVCHRHGGDATRDANTVILV